MNWTFVPVLRPRLGAFARTSKQILTLAALLLASLAQAQSWQPVSGGPASVAPSAVGGGGGNTLYAGFGGSGVYKSTDNGATWTKSSSGLESNGSDPNSATVGARAFLNLGSRVLHGNSVQSWRNGVAQPIFYSDNAGSTWTQGSAPNLSLIDFRGFVRLGNYVFAADDLDGIVWYSTDNGANWTSSRNGIPQNVGGFTSSGIGQSVTIAGTRVLLVTKVWGVYASDDLGQTWYDDNNGIPLTPYSVFPIRAGYDIVTATNGTVFASVDGLVYHSTNNGTSWNLTFAGLPITSVRRLAALGDKVYGNTGSTFFEIDINTLNIRQLPFDGMDTVHDDAFYAYNGYLYCGGASALMRLNLNSATRSNYAPAFNTQPVGANKLAGQSYTFSVSVYGTGPFTYNWRKGSQSLGAPNSPTLTLNNLAAGDTGSYDVVVTGPGGSTTSTAVTLNVQTIVPGTLDSTWGPNTANNNQGNPNGSSSAVYAIEPNADGSFWMAGQWDKIYISALNNPARSDFVKMANDGTVALDTSAGFASNPSFGASIEDILVDSQGRVLAAGDLSYPNPSASTTNVVRFLANNSQDTTFKLNIPNTSQRVRVIKEYPGNKYVIGGDFTTVNGQSRKKFALLNDDGSLASGFDPFSALSTVSVYDLKVLPDNSILVAGQFSAFSGLNSCIVRVASDGTLDTSFVVPVRGTFNAFTVDTLGNGQIIFGGDFGANQNSSGNKIALVLLTPDGNVDTTFNSAGTGVGGSLTEVRDIEIQPDGKILVAGRFSTYNGTTRDGIVRLLSDGSLDTTAAFTKPASANSGGRSYVVRASSNGQYVYLGIDANSSSTATHLIRYLNSFDDPAIASSPTTISVAKNGTATLKASIYSTTAITYQWLKNGQPMDGQNSSTLTLNNVQESDFASYSLQATTHGQTLTTSPAQIRVLAAPVIASSPASLTLLGGKPLSLTVDAFGQAPLAYKWYLNGVALYGGNESFRTITGTNTLTYSNSVLRITDAGLYQLIVSNSLGKATSSVQVAVIPQPAHLATTYVGPGVNGPFSAASHHDGIIVFGTNVYLFGVYGFGGQDRYGIGRTDFDLKTQDLSFNPPFSFSTYNQPQGGFAQSDGKLVIYGSWTSLSNYTRILRLNTNGSVDSTFKTNGFPDATPSLIVPLPNDRMLIYGSGITKVGTFSTKQFAVLNADGSPDTTFKVTTGTGGQINKIMVQSDGKFLVAGSFTTFNSVTANYICRLNTDGSLDGSFSNNAVNGVINDFDLTSNGSIVIGGSFSTIGGVSRPGLARLQSDGTRDPSFTLTNAVNNSSFPPLAVVVDDDGGILVGGSTITVNSTFVGYGFRVGPDAAYDPNCLFDAFSDYRVFNLRSLPDGRILMGTASTTYNGKTISYIGVLYGYPAKLGIIQNPLSQKQPVNGSATLTVLVSGTAAWTYQWYKDGLSIPNATGSTLQLNNLQPSDAGQYSVRVQNIYRTLYSAPGKLDILAAPIITKQPVSVSARLGQTATFTVEAFGLGDLTYQWQKANIDILYATNTSLSISNITANDSALYHVKVFNSLAPSGVVSQDAALSVGAALAGTVDTTWNPGSGFTYASGSAVPPINTVIWDTNNKIVAGGAFEKYNGSSITYLARINSDATLDSNFNGGGTGPNNQVFSVNNASGGKYVVAGGFTTYSNIANVLCVVKLKSDGTRDTSFNNGASQNPGNGSFAFRTMEDSNGKVYLGYGQSSPYLKRYSSDGTFDTSFTFSAGGSYTSIEAITPVGTDKLLVGGGPFSTTAGFTRILTSTGGADGTWLNPTVGGSGDVKDIAVLNDGRILVGGAFTKMNNRTLVQNLAVVSADGVMATNLSESFGVNNWVYDLYVYPNGKVLVAGAFTTILGATRPGIARLNPDLTLDTTFDPGEGAKDATGTASDVRGVDVRSDGKIVVGGSFATFDGAPRYGVVVLNGDPDVQPLSFISPPQAAVVSAGQSATFNAAVSGGTTLSFQWYKGTQAINGATLPYLTITNATYADAGNYKVTVTSGTDTITSTPVSLTITVPDYTSFADWRAAYNLPADQIGPDDDPDGDGLPNVVEYVLGTDPTQSSSRPVAVLINDGGTNYPGVKIRRLKSAGGFDIIVEASTDINFTNLLSVINLGTTDAGNGLEDIQVRINTPALSITDVFFRIKVAPSTN